MKHTDELKAQFSYNRKQVLYLTDISEQEYQNFQIDTARAWLERYFKNIDVDGMMNCKLFWKWWNYTWSEADNESILEKLYASQSKYISYRQMHQYVFDFSFVATQQMVVDFKSMRYDFEAELKKNGTNEC